MQASNKRSQPPIRGSKTSINGSKASINGSKAPINGSKAPIIGRVVREGDLHSASDSHQPSSKHLFAVRVTTALRVPDTQELLLPYP
eukprot:72136-Rhodomonas_salina.1